MRPFTRTIPAGEEVTIDRAGRWITVLQSSAEFDVQIIDQDGVFDFGEMQAGIGWGYDGRHKGFEQIQITNKSGAPNTIKLVVSNGRYIDNRSDISEVIQSASSNPWVGITAGNPTAVSGNTPIGTAATLIRNPNSLRASCLLQNLSANDIFIGPNNSVTLLNGIKIAPGTSMVWTPQTTVYGIATVAASDLRFMDESIS